MASGNAAGRHLPQEGFGRGSLGERGGLQWRQREQFTQAAQSDLPVQVPAKDGTARKQMSRARITGE
jgi:hypothetical protein